MEAEIYRDADETIEFNPDFLADAYFDGNIPITDDCFQFAYSPRIVFTNQKKSFEEAEGCCYFIFFFIFYLFIYIIFFYFIEFS